jgi:hypothetical protein
MNGFSCELSLSEVLLCLINLFTGRYTWQHQTSDGRGMFPAVDRLLRNLQEELEGNAVPYRCLPWGEEISRLTPIAMLTMPDVGAEDMPGPSSQSPEPVSDLLYLY